MSRKPYACSTLRRNYVKPQDTFLVQDGYIKDVTADGLAMEKKPRWVYMKNRMSRDCRYDRIATDPQCEGCYRGKMALEKRERQ